MRVVAYGNPGVQPGVQYADQGYGVDPNAAMYLDGSYGVQQGPASQPHHGFAHLFHHPEVGTAIVPNNPAGVEDPNMIWDEARGGYWIKETVADQTPAATTHIFPHGGGRIVRTTEWTEPEHDDVMVVKKVKKHRKCESSDEEPEVVVVVPPPIFYVPVPQPAPEPKCPSQPTGFFPLARNKPFRMETQERNAYIPDQCCNTCY
jgi:hypothetical protein